MRIIALGLLILLTACAADLQQTVNTPSGLAEAYFTGDAQYTRDVLTAGCVEQGGTVAKSDLKEIECDQDLKSARRLFDKFYPNGGPILTRSFIRFSIAPSEPGGTRVQATSWADTTDLSGKDDTLDLSKGGGEVLEEWLLRMGGTKEQQTRARGQGGA